MKILLLGDRRLYENPDRNLLRRLSETIQYFGQEADALSIVGNLTEAAAYKWPDAIRWFGMYYPTAQPVLLSGNHDYYGGNLGTLESLLDRLCLEARCGFGQTRCMELGDTGILMHALGRYPPFRG